MPLDEFVRLSADPLVSRPPMSLSTPIRHLLAALLAACVLLLGLATQAPSLHAALCGTIHAHHHEAADCDDQESGSFLAPLGAHASTEGQAPSHNGAPHPLDSSTAADNHVCAVTLFAAGCETPAVFSLCPPTTLNAVGVASFTELLLSRTLRGPERACGPPALA